MTRIKRIFSNNVDSLVGHGSTFDVQAFHEYLMHLGRNLRESTEDDFEAVLDNAVESLRLGFEPGNWAQYGLVRE